MLEWLVNTGLSGDETTPIETPAKVNRWLDHIGATDPIERQEVIDKCVTDPDALAYFLKRHAEDCITIDPEDNRRSCQHCANLAGDQCRAIQRREIKPSWDHNRELMRRCPGFAPRPDDPDQRPAKARWPKLF